MSDRMCQACFDGDHVNCGMQTWCECDCDPEAVRVGWCFENGDDNDLAGSVESVESSRQPAKLAGPQTGSAVDSAKSPTDSPTSLAPPEPWRLLVAQRALAKQMRVHAEEINDALLGSSTPPGSAAAADERHLFGTACDLLMAGADAIEYLARSLHNRRSSD